MVDGTAANSDAAAGMERAAGRALAGARGGADAQELALGECAGMFFFVGGEGLTSVVCAPIIRTHFACTN